MLGKKAVADPEPGRLCGKEVIFFPQSLEEPLKEVK